MDQLPQLLVAAIGTGLVVLLVLRLAVAGGGRLRRLRHPEWRTIRVVGVGGGGSNAVDRMVEARLPAVDFVACNTDAQVLRRSRARARLRIGDSITHGLGAGGDPDVGRRAAEEDIDRIGAVLAGADLVFLAVGLGGGTGSGAAPIIAAKAREQGALTIAVATLPFGFEGARRSRIAKEAAQELTSEVDALITIPNDRVVDAVAPDTPMIEAFRRVDDVLLEVARGIIDLLRSPGLVNVDFADLRTVMQRAGPALVGIGRGRGDDRAAEAARAATTGPLLDVGLGGARRVLLAVAGSSNLRLGEVTAAAEGIRAAADSDADIIFGASVRDELGDELVVTLIAADLGGRSVQEVAAVTERAPAARRRRAASRGTPDPVPAAPVLQTAELQGADEGR